MKWERMSNSKASGGMGFRDFTCFNKALLAKQSWRLWSNPDSLVARLMKAKYYSKTSILESKIGRRPSFVWRSIWSSCDLLKEGLAWRVGNGSNIRIWKDKWLPDPGRPRILSSPLILNPDATVSELVDDNSKWWNIHLLNLIFSPEEVMQISSIPPSCTNRKDALIWRGSKTGRFSVRSAYFLHKDLNKRGVAESSQTREHSTLWKKVWALPIPNTEKNFMWRALNDILPTKDNLRRKKILQEPLCPICGLEPETTLHILWECQSSRDVWSLGSRVLQKSAIYGENFKEVIENLLQRCSQEDMIQVAGLTRRIWLRRNEVVFGGSCHHLIH
jgi:hypothetical protein